MLGVIAALGSSWGGNNLSFIRRGGERKEERREREGGREAGREEWKGRYKEKRTAKKENRD